MQGLAFAAGGVAGIRAAAVGNVQRSPQRQSAACCRPIPALAAARPGPPGSAYERLAAARRGPGAYAQARSFAHCPLRLASAGSARRAIGEDQRGPATPLGAPAVRRFVVCASGEGEDGTGSGPFDPALIPWAPDVVGKWLLAWTGLRYACAVGIFVAIGGALASLGDPAVMRQPLESFGDPVRNALGIASFSVVQAGAGLAALALLIRPYGDLTKLAEGFRFDFGDRAGRALGLACGFASLAAVELVRRVENPDAIMDLGARFLSAASEPQAVLLYALSSSVVAPLFEEVAFRGLVQRSLRARLGPLPALAATSVLFAVSHASPAHFWTYLAGSALFGAAYELSGGNLAASATAHALYNTFYVLAVLVVGSSGVLGS